MNATMKKLSILAAMAALALPFTASAQGAFQDVVKDARGNVVVDSDGDCVLTKWTSDMNECTGMARVHSVYFPFNRSILTPEAKATLDDLVAYIGNPSNNVSSISVVGYADQIGSDSYNLRLSEKRAKNVVRYISKKGYVNANLMDVRALGESSSVTNCQGLKGRKLIDCLWEDRRVDIELNSGK